PRGRSASGPEKGMERFRIEVGENDNIKPGNIVGAIANEAGIDSKYIGRIQIYDQYSTVDLPDDLPNDVLRKLKKIRVAKKQMQLSKFNEAPKFKSSSKKKKKR
ncbi:DbpA RNA binding domain-containing protein, partial [bacterium]|nr:DbpA RNA binding domain-containing protein [bacterium]